MFILGNRPESVEEYFNASLRELNLDYVDLYLIHVPFAFVHVPGDLHPKNPDGTIKFEFSTDLEGIWKVSDIILSKNSFTYNIL